ncbi:MAG: nucleoside hydrolase [Pirellulaceae bacterium]|nr:MAG: nucleoside hydrolase [Pirellulaceae bacterium]GIW94268.1 MAG: nucleoside hydrolase [Pirellulaceae bacterium]
MPQKVLIDCSPGIDDAIALAIALFEPKLEVVAVTAVEGAVTARQATDNLQAWVELLDPPRLPRFGAATPRELAPELPWRRLLGSDGLGDLKLRQVTRHREHPSEKLIYDEIYSAPDDVTLVALGPLTNVARAFQRDPELVRRLGRLIVAGGSFTAVGDVTPVAESNIFFDPESARAVFRSPCTKTLVPLEAARRVPVYLDILDCLPDDGSAGTDALRRLISHYFRVFHQHFGWEHVLLPRTMAVVYLLRPELFEVRPMAGDVELRGELTVGQTVFDRRSSASWQNNMEVVVDVCSPEAVREVMRSGLLRLV